MENNKTRKKISGFAVFMFIYVFIFCAAAFFGLRYLYGFLEEYEISRPRKVLEEYVSAVKGGSISEEALTVLDSIDTDIQSKEEALSFIAEKLSGAEFLRASNESTDDTTVYTIKSGSDIIGRAVMGTVGETAHGFALREFTDAEFYFEQFLSCGEISVPSSYSVSANGTTLPDSCITEKGIKYAALSDYYEEYPDAPTLVSYKTGQVLGGVALTVTDNNGNTFSGDELTENIFLGSYIDSELSDRIDRYISEFTDLYAVFTSNVNGAPSLNYEHIKQLVVRDSPLHERLRLAVGSLSFTSCRQCNVLGYAINFIAPLSDNVYLVDASYSTFIEGSTHETSTTETNIRLIIEIDESGKILASSMSTY